MGDASDENELSPRNKINPDISYLGVYSEEII